MLYYYTNYFNIDLEYIVILSHLFSYFVQEKITEFVTLNIAIYFY